MCYYSQRGSVGRKATLGAVCEYIIVTTTTETLSTCHRKGTIAADTPMGCIRDLKRTRLFCV